MPICKEPELSEYSCSKCGEDKFMIQKRKKEGRAICANCGFQYEIKGNVKFIPFGSSDQLTSTQNGSTKT